MRVLLISANTEQINMPVLPMGLACVATATERAGHEVHFLNLMAREGSLTALEQSLASFRPEVIGISVRNIDDQAMQSPKFLLDPVKEIVACCRRHSEAPIVLGGAGFSIFPQSTLAYLEADMGIAGEGEQAFPMLLDRLARGADPTSIPGLVLRDDISVANLLIRELDALPLPAPGGLLSFPQSFNGEKVWLPFQTRRGCPMECSYCSTAAIEGTLLRKRSVRSAVDAMARFADAGFTRFFLVDNTFNLPPSYAMDFCREIVSRGLKVQWRAILYPWKVDEVLVESMARAGCVEVSFGFESGSREILNAMNKRFEPEEVRTIAAMLGRQGIGRMGFLLLGGPGETKETVLESLEFADSLGLEAMKVTAGIRIYPFTRLAQIAVEEGLIDAEDDLLLPKFYLAKKLNGWLQETLDAWTATRPNWYR